MRREASPIGEVLPPLLRQWRREQAVRTGLNLPETVGTCLGGETAREVGFDSLRRGILTLTVDNAALRGELEAFRKGPLLAAIQAAPGGGKVRELRFVSAGGRA